MAEVAWQFKHGGEMSVPADAMASPLRSTNLEPAELLVREAIQNSADESLKGRNEPVRFVISRTELRGEEKARVVGLLQLSVIRERAKNFGDRTHGWFNEAKDTLENLDDPDFPFAMLSVSDYQTNGLGGQWNKEGYLDNRFHNLVLSLFASEKLNDPAANLLGSYGVGKMVFAMTSRIRTMAYYSVFKPTDQTENEHARFMATGFFPRHETEDGEAWTGHGFFGEPSGDPHYTTRPIVDESAHEFVEAMGFERRGEKETGTTVFLLDCKLSVEECRSACEKYWWPRLLDKNDEDYVEIEFKDQGKLLPAVQPLKNKAIRPFIECYRVLQAGDNGLQGYYFARRMPKTGDKGGSLCLKQADGKSTETNLVNSIALIRRGLVIRYEKKKYVSEGRPEIVGVFTVSPENLAVFTYSEPEAHDDWVETQDRLRQALGDKGPQLIKRTHRGIENFVKDTQISLEDRTEARLAEDADFLDHILGPIFDKKKKPPTPPTSKDRAISIHKSSRQEKRNGQLVQVLDVAVALADVADVDVALATIAIDFKPLVSADESKGPSVPRKIFSVDRKVLAEQDMKTVKVQIEKEHRTELTAEAVCHRSWKANWVVTVVADPASV